MSAHEKHSKASEEAMKDQDRHSTGAADAVPDTGEGEHNHSQAAHLGGNKAHTKPVGDQRAIADKEEGNRDNGRSTESYRNA